MTQLIRPNSGALPCSYWQLQLGFVILENSNSRWTEFVLIEVLIKPNQVHNIPEGLAVGVSFATGNFAVARNTAIGIGIQV